MKNELLKQQENIFALVGPKREALTDLGILKEILSFDKEVIKDALGNFGLRLHDFASCVDLTHPDVGQTVIFKDGYSELFSQLLKLVDIAKKNNLTRPIKDLVKCSLGDLPQEFKFIDTPIRNQRYVRLLPDRRQRDYVRSTKSKCPIDLRLFYMKGVSAWDGLPNDFSMYIRGNNTFREEIAKAERKAERYRSMGCKELYEKINDSISQFKDVMEDTYYGFHRLSMTSAAVILAKIHNFKYDAVAKKVQVPLKDIVNDEKGPQFADYAARAYPIKSFKTSTPEKVLETIERLESFEDAGGKSIFDHYVVIVPSILLPEKIAFNYNEDVETKLDVTLVEKELVTPILVGEKDGLCYFISYWL